MAVSELGMALDEKRHALRGMNAAISTEGATSGLTTNSEMFQSCYVWYNEMKAVCSKLARTIENGG